MENKTKKELRRAKRRQVFDKLKLKYRLVILDENTFAEKFSLRLSPLNLFIWVGSLSFLLVIGTSMIIAYTPLREFIPGYPDGSEEQKYLDNQIKADSLEMEIKKYEEYVSNILLVLNGQTNPDTSNMGQRPVDYKNIEFKRSPQDSALRQKVEAEEKYDLQFGKTQPALTQDNMYGIFFFTPLEGTLSQSFNAQKGHYGIDIISPANESIHATLDGTVIFSDWTSDGGNEIHIQHSNNLVSIYKHNSVLLKSTGDVIKAGDPIAFVGNSGKQSEGPHLHFELWHKGKPIDPQLYLIL